MMGLLADSLSTALNSPQRQKTRSEEFTTGEGAGGREGMQPGVQSPTCPCLMPAPKPNDSQITFASSMTNNCSQCPSWTAVARAAAGRLTVLTTISASVAAAHTLARGHTALRLAVRKVHAQRTRTACAPLADATWCCRLHLVACVCIVLHPVQHCPPLCVCAAPATDTLATQHDARMQA